MNKEELIQKKEVMLEIMRNQGLTDFTLKKHDSRISLYIDFLVRNNLDPCEDSENSFVGYILKVKKKDVDSYYERTTRTSIYRFVRFIETGFVTSNSPVVQHDICGGLSDSMNNFLETKIDELSRSTYMEYKRCLKFFNDYLKSNSILELRENIIYNFFVFSKESGKSEHRLYSQKTVLKKYFNYLFSNKITDIDYSVHIPKIKYIRNRKLPSVFTSEEIKSIIQQIDRNSDIGRRAYAMIILAVRYGLRACDVVELKFEDIDWNNNLIRIEQKKTKRMVELPLLPEVGNAILDYLKYSRRDSELPFVFLPAKGPIQPMKSSAFYTILNKYITSANIKNLDARHHGPHSLRHSLASELLKAGKGLPTISGILGHSSTEVTKVYLSIDENSLKKCAISFPKLKAKIYQENNACH